MPIAARHASASWLLRICVCVWACWAFPAPARLAAQCGVTIPNGERCPAPGGTNCEFYVCFNNNCVPSGILYAPGTKCGCFGDECYEDFCDASGNCQCGFFPAKNNIRCASDQDVCNGVNLCDGFSGPSCLGGITYPVSGCDDGIPCTENCNPVTGCVTYIFNNRCNDNDPCTQDLCDTAAAKAGCINVCLDPNCNSPACVSFPVEWLSLTAKEEGNSIRVEWITGYEINNRGFEVEFSADGEHFVLAGFVAGQRNSQEPSFYSFKTPILQYGKTYIRLRQLDLDGKYSYSPVLIVNTRAPGALVLEPVWINPVSGEGSVRFTSAEAMPADINLYDRFGRVVRRIYKGYLRAGAVYQVPFEVRGLSPGIYYLDLRAGPQDRKTQKCFITP